MNALLRRMVGALLCAASMTLPAHGQALGSGLTYQGRLQQSGAPVNATADLQFRLFDALAGGAQVGGAQAVSNVSVVDGLFTATIDFGPSAFNGGARWLQIDVRSPAGGGTFVTLAPRQAMSAAPYARFSAAPWATSGADISYTGGFAGVGTTTPTRPLHVQANDLFTARFENSHATGAAIEFRSASSDVTWEYGVAGSAPPFGLPAGSIYMYKPGQVAPGLAVTPIGEVKMGFGAKLFATSGEENLRILRGGISIGGGITTGSGFSSTQTATGTYLITFDTAFSGLPIVTASVPGVASDPPMVAMVGPFSHTQVAIDIKRATDGVPVSRPFRFIAIGPR